MSGSRTRDSARMAAPQGKIGSGWRLCTSSPCAVRSRARRSSSLKLPRQSGAGAGDIQHEPHAQQRLPPFLGLDTRTKGRTGHEILLSQESSSS